MKKNSIKEALVMTLTDASSDPRPLRYIQYLNEKSIATDLISYPFEKPTDVAIREQFELPSTGGTFWRKIKRRLKNLIPLFVIIIPAKTLRVFLINLQHDLYKIQRILRNHSYDLIVVQDLYMLPVAIQMRGKSRVLFDAREFYPAQNEESLWFRIFVQPVRYWICKIYLSHCDHITTVSHGLKIMYEKTFNVNVSVFRSIPGYFNITPGKVSDKRIKIVHHGLANRNRQIEKMIEIVKNLSPNFTFDLYLKVFDQSYLQQLENLVKNEDRIKIHEPIPYEKIIPVISEYDIGFVYAEPTTLNIKHGLPNKLFEFIQARLMLAIGPSPDMSRIVYGYDCGVVAEEFTVESMMNALINLKSSDVYAYKLNTDKAAKILNFENEQVLLNNLLKKWAIQNG